MSRYGAILSKFGLGLTMREFATARSRGEVVGHYGFEQAIGALASGLGWISIRWTWERSSPLS
ncbi:hypothetical protein [Streptomyces chrestomyceticus]|uniref:hypothetical protein n=1 Tax=Streptomyces chrestomyceticus TaxID=68185 RepID=UPI0035A90DDE